MKESAEQNADDEDNAEYLVRVKWILAVPVSEAIHEVGFFGSQNSRVFWVTSRRSIFSVVMLVKTLAPQKIVFLRHVGPYSGVGATRAKLCSWAGPRGLLGPATRFFGISWDDPDVTPADKLRYDAAITVNRPVTPEGEIGVTELPGGEYATLLHRGPYGNLARSYQLLLGGWLPLERPGTLGYARIRGVPQFTRQHPGRATGDGHPRSGCLNAAP